MGSIASVDIGLVLGYTVLMILIGFLSGRKQSPEHYMTHGRNLGLFPFIATTSASWIGGGAIVAYGAYVFEYGISALLVYVGVLINMIVFMHYAPLIRREGHEHNHITLADYFFAHFGVRSGMASVCVLSAAVFLFILNQFIAGSAVLSSLSGWSYEVALLISGIVVMLYLLLGGMKSVVRTDIFQYISMILLLIVLGVSMTRQTGIDPALLNLRAMSPGLAIAFILYGLFTPFASGEIWQRIYMAKNDRIAKWGLLGAGVCIVSLGGAITLIAMAAKTYAPFVEPQEAIPYGMVHLLPHGTIGLGLIVLFAAIMSSIDTLIFYLSSSIAKDWHNRILKHDSAFRMERVTKLSILGITVLSLCGAFFFRNLIEVIITVAGIISALVPPVLGSFHMQLKDSAVCAALVASSLYVAGLVLFGYILPELAMMSLLVSAVTLMAGQLLFRS